MSTLDLIAALSIMTAITFSQKYIPFIALSQVSNSRELRYLGQKLPAAVMLILVLYTLQEASHPKADEVSLFIPSLIAAFGTACIHLVLRHALVSIAGGVIIYGILKSI
jgi:branched-subunit amino acid transport protein AzlD